MEDETLTCLSCNTSNTYLLSDGSGCVVSCSDNVSKYLLIIIIIRINYLVLIKQNVLKNVIVKNL